MRIVATEPAFADSEAYHQNGYLHLPGLVQREIAIGLLARMRGDFARQGVDFAKLEKEGPLLARPAVEIYSHHYPLFATFHWGLTSAVTKIVGEPLLPTYCYFRLYREGDICRIHGDRPACEHSLSLTLAYADDRPWPLEVATIRTDQPYQRADAQFGPEEANVAVAMAQGDAVLYQGVHHHHGRTLPNPNRWSAHLFLHWVAQAGPYADNAFDGQPPPDSVQF